MITYNPFQAYTKGNIIKFTNAVGGIIGNVDYVLRAKDDLPSGSPINEYNYENLSKQVFIVTTEFQASVLTTMYGDKIITTSNNNIWENTTGLISENDGDTLQILKSNSDIKFKGVFVDDGTSDVYNVTASLCSLREKDYDIQSHRSIREYFSYFAEYSIITYLVNLKNGSTVVITYTGLGDLVDPEGNYVSPLIRLYYDKSNITIESDANSESNQGLTWNINSKIGDIPIDTESVKLVVSNRNGKYYARLIRKIY